MTIDSRYDEEMYCVEQEYQEGLIDEKEYLARMKELEEDYKSAKQNIIANDISDDDLPW